jgi:hypothetical protein
MSQPSLLIAVANQQHFSRYPVPNEGRIMIVIYAGWDAVDAVASSCVFFDARTSDVGAYGEVVWS